MIASLTELIMFSALPTGYRKMISRLIFLLLFLFPAISHGQIEGVYVERYYVSDLIDATDTTGGGLEEGSVTYRIFIDLKVNSRLVKVYGDVNHALRFSSTEEIWNNKADGQSFGKEFSRNRLQENTVALDSWLTLGQTTRTGTRTSFGVPKQLDDDGSFIGGVNNDGGSAMIPDGLLNNSDPDTGIPITLADGMDTMMIVPSLWVDYGIKNDVSGVDSTVFGSVKEGNEFVCFNCGLQNSGVTGVSTDSNLVLIAQITTKGELSFELNVVVEEPASPNNILVKYVSAFAPGEFNSDTLKLSPFLKFPAQCGCRDPHYLEFSPSFSCNIQDSCRTLIRLGCMDTVACNYDPSANFHVSQICCYPGFCNDRDIGVVCPELNYGRIKNGEEVTVYPSPASSELFLEYYVNEEPVEYSILNIYGAEVLSFPASVRSGLIVDSFDISRLSAGIYYVRMSIGERTFFQKWIKN